MKLDILTIESLEQAALKIDRDGIPKDHVWSQYYFTVKDKEYPFKYLVYQAMDYLGIERVKFESTDGYRKYMQETFGLVMTYYPGGYNFFTREELEYYHSITNLPYRKDNPKHQVYRDKLSSLIAKVNYWGQELETGPYKFRADRMWLSNFDSNIKPYIWPRVFKDTNKDIFFNVEVNGKKRFLGYKLDGYFHTQKSLSPAQIQIMEDFKSEIGWQWIKIDFNDIGNYNWERLINETKAYIAAYDHHYDVLRKRLYKTSLTGYLSWNSNGWVYPSGMAGKDSALLSQTTAGFSYDEWFFDGR